VAVSLTWRKRPFVPPEYWLLIPDYSPKTWFHLPFSGFLLPKSGFTKKNFQKSAGKFGANQQWGQLFSLIPADSQRGTTAKR
jgi:hypothetical protein